MSNPHAAGRGPRAAHAPLTTEQHAAQWAAHIEHLAARDARRATHSAPITHEAWDRHVDALRSRSGGKRTSS